MICNILLVVLNLLIWLLIFALGRCFENSDLTEQHREERRLLENELFKQAEVNAKLTNAVFNLQEENKILKEGIRRMQDDKT